MALAGCAELYNRELSKPTLDIYWHTLKGLPLEAVLAALEAHFKTGRFMPTPADILDRARGGSADDKAVLAWPKVLYTLDLRSWSEWTLIPDGAACKAAQELLDCRVPHEDLKFKTRFFHVVYAKAHEDGLSELPGVFKWPNDPFEPVPRRALYKIWWPAETAARFERELRAFAADYREQLGLPGPSALPARKES